QVEVPLLEAGGRRQCAHIGISVRGGQGLTFYRRRCALGGGKRGGALRHLAILGGDPTLGMRRPADRDAAVPDVDVRMVVLALREPREPAYEVDGSGKRGKLELPDERIVLLLPVRHAGSIPVPGRANAARSYETAEECVNRVTETSSRGHGAATVRPRPYCSAATGAMPGARHTRSPDGARSPT